jgi:hemolysin activation/secretion protein
LLHTNFRVVPNPKEANGSWLIVEVVEIAVRRVSVETDGSVRAAVLNDIQKEASRIFYKEKVLDLNELDDTIKSRLRLGDVLLQTSVIPVDEKHVDLKVVVKTAPKGAISALIQIDNNGGWSVGRDRLVGGASFQGLVPGDRFDVLAMKTADVENGDYGNGTYFGRAEYQVPVGEWGVRLDAWMSGLHYHEVKKVPTNVQSNGEALEFGQGVIRPVYVDDVTVFDVRGDIVMKYAVDRMLETVRTGEKFEYGGRIRAMLSRALWSKQMLQLNLGLTEGVMDLSGNKDALAQDRAGPKVNGAFTKIESDATWFGRMGKDDRTDFRFSMKGQWAPNNLDSIEQFSLGGATGLRAFGSGEAYGDIGFMTNADLGYTFDNGYRVYGLYDIGTIWKSANPWPGEGNNLNYTLHDIGVGVTKSFNLVDLSLTFAHQIGSNPGLSASGRDIDNTKQSYRVWSSISYRY